jgi:tungstate transport system substrate-binding protein
MQSLDKHRRKATPGAPSGRSRGRFRLASALIGLAATLLFFAMPSLARADSASSLTVVGTSDVSDSGLWQNVLQPAFKAAYPQFSSTYTGSATGVAINSAKAGTGGPSVLIVHAASLENSFVSGGYSYNNQYGNAIFTNSFVVAGPKTDPAGVATSGGTNNVAQAFATIAAAGVAGRATYFSRGGTTTASGTTVEEHAIWQLVYSAGLTPAGVDLCVVSAADGGGMTPINTTNSGNVTNGGACPTAAPDSGSVSGPDLPSWEQINGTPTTQAGNLVDTNNCSGTGIVTGACYTLTDIGTWDYLSSGNSPSGTAAVATGNLQIVSRDNSASAPGGANALINYFHAYIINPNVAGETVNLPAAQDFVSLITSPAVQARIAQYLNTTSDPDGAPFKATASPGLTESGLATTVAAGTPVTVTGQVTNEEPGFAAVSGQPVTVNEVVGGTPIAVATGTTTATGSYSITFSPPSTGTYTVSTGSISLIENATLSPAYGDILSPASTAAALLVVNGTAAITSATASPGRASVAGNIGPAAPDGNATITLLSRPAGSKSAYTPIGSQTLTKGQSTFAVNGNLSGGNVSLVVQYSDPGQLTSGTSAATTLTVPRSTVAAKKAFSKFTLKGTKLTLKGTLAQAPVATTGTVVHLYALAVGQVKVTKTTTKKKAVRTAEITDAAKAATFKQVAKVTVKKGKTSYTITHKFKAGYRYVVQLKFTGKGQTGTFSKYKYITVK